MANAVPDGNHVRSRLAVLNTDTVQGQTLVPIAINEGSGGLMVDTVATISFTMLPIDPRDENYRACMMFVGSDGLTYPWVANSDGGVLIDN